MVISGVSAPDGPNLKTQPGRDRSELPAHTPAAAGRATSALDRLRTVTRAFAWKRSDPDARSPRSSQADAGLSFTARTRPRVAAILGAATGRGNADDQGSCVSDAGLPDRHAD